MKTNLTKVQDSALNILKSIIPLMEKYNLKYSMLGGTLLGAVRHKGFIPWDDDIDIGLPRQDYDQLFEIAQSELPAPLEMQSVLIGNGHYGYMRIVDPRVKLLRTVGEMDEVIYSWIDIFPLDSVPNGFIGKVWRISASLVYKVFIASDYSYMVAKDDGKKKRSFIMRFIRFMCRKLNLERFLNSKKCAQLLNTILKMGNYDHCKRICNFMGYWGEKEEFPKEIYDDLIKFPFEDIELLGPRNYDFVLSQMYGDYMTPPPEEDRNHHMISYIK